ncbi:MAG: cell division protein ZapA [Candidatus Azobacteroides sp.]|jgi:cell division protein ZapA|nr:cell division protein ZapA [Candidatus Azobacteroides sp.]
MTDDKLRIKIQIEGREYPLFINRKEEEMYRKARLKLSSIVGQYKTRYSKTGNLDTQDFLAMTAYQFSVDNLLLAEEKDIDTFTDKVRQLTAEIEKYLQEE